MCRISLIPGILKTVASNKRVALPIKVFEISDVVLKDPTRDVGARNERRLCVIYYGQTSGLEVGWENMRRAWLCRSCAVSSLVRAARGGALIESECDLSCIAFAALQAGGY